MANNPYVALIQKYFPETEWQRAYNVMMGESGGRPGAVGDTNTPYSSYGLFQIRALPGRPDPKILLDPEENVKYAAKLFSKSSWSPWTAAKKLGYVGTKPAATKPAATQPVQQPETRTVAPQITPVQTPRPVPTPVTPVNFQSSALWPVLQMRNTMGPLASTVTLPGSQSRRGKSIPEVFYGTKV